MGRGGRNLKFGGAGRSVDKGRVGGVGILLGEWIDIGGLDISLNMANGGASLRSSNRSPSQKKIRMIFAISSTPHTSRR
jgi:hypothetical protein